MKPGEQFNPYMKFFGLFVPNSIAQSDIPDASKLLLGRLMQFAGQDGKAYPTRKKLAIELCWSTIKLDRVIKNLKNLKLIKTVTKDPDNYQSPNYYIFLYHEMYDTPLIKNDNTPVSGNDSTPLIKNDNTPLSKMIGHNIISSIDDGLIDESFSYEKDPSGEGRKSFNGLLCKVCNEKQFTTRSGATCINGHGGMEGIEPKEKKILPKLGKIKKIEPKLQGFRVFDYSTEAREILKCWHNNGGKLHVNGSTKGAPMIQGMIDALLIEGWNPYTRVVDSEIGVKKWTTKEIISCIEFHAQKLKKDISQEYFNRFVILEQRGYNGRSKADYSPLVTAFETMPQKSEWAEILEKRFKETFVNVDLYPAVFMKIAKFLESKVDDYKIIDPGNLSYLPNMFLSYMKRKIEISGKSEELKYMSSTKNLEEFFSSRIACFKAVKRTPEEKAKWIKEKPIREKNRKKAREANAK